MHEMSVATEVCRIATEAVGESQCPSIVRVGVEVGRDSGIEPENLAFWLEALLAEAPFSGATPHIDLTAGVSLTVSYLEVRDVDPED